MAALPQGTSELMCHPGVCDDDLRQLPTHLQSEREDELCALTDPSVRRAADERGIRLIGFSEILRNHAA
jgi:predicted glycoside hydrolase/deacetylase ChbG (UPF0249 family)